MEGGRESRVIEYRSGKKHRYSHVFDFEFVDGDYEKEIEDEDFETETRKN